MKISASVVFLRKWCVRVVALRLVGYNFFVLGVVHCRLGGPIKPSGQLLQLQLLVVKIGVALLPHWKDLHRSRKLLATRKDMHCSQRLAMVTCWNEKGFGFGSEMKMKNEQWRYTRCPSLSF
jgi:hypothetical protein